MDVDSGRGNEKGGITDQMDWRYLRAESEKEQVLAPPSSYTFPRTYAHIPFRHRVTRRTLVVTTRRLSHATKRPTRLSPSCRTTS